MNANRCFFGLSVIIGLVACCKLGIGHADEADQKRKEYDIARRAHDLLAHWVEEGTASGLDDVWWDNCDGGHSRVNLDQLPGMKQFDKSGWGLQLGLRDKTTIGNSSTAHKQIERGSQTRGAYSSPFGLSALRKQYRGNNLYVYPSHMDYITGNQRLGTGQTKKKGAGRGDMFPTNTPFAITSLGSSGSDKPFIRAAAWTIGSFRPNVRRYLEQNGILIPALQMLLRRKQQHVVESEDYFSGKAHPTVFDRKHLHPIAMMHAAHDMTLRDIPALVQLSIIEEDLMSPGTDFIGPPAMTEKLFDSPEVISRVWRGYPNTRRMVVSAESTINPSKAPLTYRWVVLRGDSSRVSINKLRPDGSVAEVIVSYPFRHNSTDIDGMWSNRVDIGVFASNRRSVSVPAFITWMGLDHEQRIYDSEGRLLEIDYGTKRFVDPRLARPSNYRDAIIWDNGKVAGIKRTFPDMKTKILRPDGKEKIESNNTGFQKSRKIEGSRNLLESDNASPTKNQVDPATLKKPPVPTPNQITEAEQNLKSILSQPISARIEQAHGRDDTEFYVLVRSACLSAAQQGELMTVKSCLEMLGHKFNSDLLALRCDSISQLIGSRRLVAAKKEDVANLALLTCHIAQSAGHLKEAETFARRALVLARQTRNISLQRGAARLLSQQSKEKPVELE